MRVLQASPPHSHVGRPREDGRPPANLGRQVNEGLFRGIGRQPYLLPIQHLRENCRYSAQNQYKRVLFPNPTVAIINNDEAYQGVCSQGKLTYSSATYRRGFHILRPCYNESRTGGLLYEFCYNRFQLQMTNRNRQMQ